MIAKFDEIEEFAKDCMNTAKAAATSIQFSRNEKYAKSLLAESGSIRMSLIGDDPDFAELNTGYGMSAWAIILSVDMRGSSNRAIKIGAKGTYLTMHTYLPTMAELVARSDGKIVGLRGDGLFAAFGTTKLIGTGREVTPEASAKAIRSAVDCAHAMHDAVDEIINPLLASEDIDRNVQIGIGIDVGDTVVTRIGLRNANEVTAYGPPVNNACKLTSKTYETIMSPSAKAIYPKSKGGRMGFRQTGDGFVVSYPPDWVTLERSDNLIGTRRPK